MLRAAFRPLLLAVTAAAVGLSSARAAAADTTLSFNRDIRPILSENCFACHGFDAKHRKAGLRLDTPEGATTAIDGLFPIKPGSPEQSEVWKRLITTDPDEIMPPPESHKTLTPAQKETLGRWIAQGAPYQKHWAFESPTEAPGATIDSLLEQRLQLDRLTLADEADKATLIRRVAFTLTGLPPTLAEVDAFLADSSPTAYESMVDRYLKSPRYGEEMARHWLDVARYADTHGLHLDNERSMWPYRDWVVRAFNQNLPFDQFTLWQIAGDLLPSATPDQITATGFSRCNVTTSEGGAINEEYRHLYAIDRAATLTTVWLGLTGGCAQCHDHKYDPLTTAEFYSLYAFFYSAADPPMDGNIAATAPYEKLPTPAQQQTLNTARQSEAAALAALEKAVATLNLNAPPAPTAAPTRVTQVLFDDVFAPGTENRNTTRNPPAWLDQPDFGARSGRRVLLTSNGQFSEQILTPSLIPVVLEEKPELSVWVRPDPLNPPRALALAINGRRVLWGDPAAFASSTYAQDNAITAGPLPPPGQWTRLVLDPATALGLKPGATLNTLSLQQFGGTVAWDQLQAASSPGTKPHPLTSFEAWWQKLASTKKTPPDLPAALAKTLTTPPDKVTEPSQRAALQRFYLARVALPATAEIADLRSAWEHARTATEAADSAIPGTLVFRDMAQPLDTFIALRGQYNTLGDKVEPATPAAFHPLKKAAPRANRLDLARWITAPENPMTARVTVNRFWQQVFGIGLVKTSHDLGSQGEPPSHPELLDSLAVRFQRSGWNVKGLIKDLVMSRAFRQASRVESHLLQLDPENRLLARGPRIRLDAEQIRDNALFVSGLIQLDMGGRGVRTYQPPNIWEPVGYGDSNTRYYLQDHGPALYRRSLYCFLKRTAPPPFMSNFDAPNREQSCTRRERSNTPLQALQLQNDVQHFEAARALAERVLDEGGPDDSARLSWLFRTVLSRTPDATESRLLTAALAKQRALFQADPAAAAQAIRTGESTPRKLAPAPETAAWTLVANLVLNLDETITRN